MVALIALTAGHWDTGNWLAFHTLLAGCVRRRMAPADRRAHSV